MDDMHLMSQYSFHQWESSKPSAIKWTAWTSKGVRPNAEIGQASSAMHAPSAKTVNITEINPQESLRKKPAHCLLLHFLNFMLK